MGEAAARAVAEAASTLAERDALAAERDALLTALADLRAREPSPA